MQLELLKLHDYKQLSKLNSRIWALSGAMSVNSGSGIQEIIDAEKAKLNLVRSLLSTAIKSFLHKTRRKFLLNQPHTKTTAELLVTEEAGSIASLGSREQGRGIFLHIYSK